MQGPGAQIIRKKMPTFKVLHGPGVQIIRKKPFTPNVLQGPGVQIALIGDREGHQIGNTRVLQPGVKRSTGGDAEGGAGIPIPPPGYSHHEGLLVKALEYLWHTLHLGHQENGEVFYLHSDLFLISYFAQITRHKHCSKYANNYSNDTNMH